MTSKKRLVCTVLVSLLVTACGSGGSSNRPPVLSDIADIEISANETSAAVAVSVADRDAVTVVAVSDNIDVVPADGIVVNGAGTEFSLLLTPAAGALGNTTITITATDPGGLTDETQFLVNVVQQQVAFENFVRDVFNNDPSGSPRDINSRTFTNDALNDDFSDLLN
ncbi:MAG: Ig-like domain-containing protein [Pseudomonadota bacterium]